MICVATSAAMASRPARSRSFFLTATTQHVKSLDVLREIARAALAVGGAAAWSALVLLLAR